MIVHICASYPFKASLCQQASQPPTMLSINPINTGRIKKLTPFFNPHFQQTKTSEQRHNLLLFIFRPGNLGIFQMSQPASINAMSWRAGFNIIYLIERSSSVKLEAYLTLTLPCVLTVRGSCSVFGPLTSVCGTLYRADVTSNEASGNNANLFFFLVRFNVTSCLRFSKHWRLWLQSLMK